MSLPTCLSSLWVFIVFKKSWRIFLLCIFCTKPLQWLWKKSLSHLARLQCLLLNYYLIQFQPWALQTGFISCKVEKVRTGNIMHFIFFFFPFPCRRYHVYPTCRNTSGVLGFSVTVETQATKFKWVRDPIVTFYLPQSKTRFISTAFPSPRCNVSYCSPKSKLQFIRVVVERGERGTDEWIKESNKPEAYNISLSSHELFFPSQYRAGGVKDWRVPGFIRGHAKCSDWGGLQDSGLCVCLCVCLSVCALFCGFVIFLCLFKRWKWYICKKGFRNVNGWSFPLLDYEDIL